jgi:hypothetical protein
MVIQKSQIRHSNWSIGDIVEDVRSDSPTRNQQFAISDYDPKTQAISLVSIPELNRVKPEFLFSQINA